MEKVSEHKFHYYQKILLTRQELIDLVKIFIDRPCDRVDLQLNNIKYNREEASIFQENIQNSDLINTIKIDCFYHEGENNGLYIVLELSPNDARFSTNNNQSKEYMEIIDKVDAILSKAELEEDKERYSHWIRGISKIYIDSLDGIISIISKNCDDIQVKVNNKIYKLNFRGGLSFHALNIESDKKILKIEIRGVLNKKVLLKGFVFNDGIDYIEVDISENGLHISGTDSNNHEIIGMIRDIKEMFVEKISFVEKMGTPRMVIPVALVWSIFFASIIYIMVNPTVQKTLSYFLLIFLLTSLLGLLASFPKTQKLEIIITDPPAEETDFKKRFFPMITSFIKNNMGALIVGILLVLVEKFVFPS